MSQVTQWLNQPKTVFMIGDTVVRKSNKKVYESTGVYYVAIR